MPTKRVAPGMGIGEVAEYFGVKRQLAHKWSRTHSDFPAPWFTLATGPVYRRQDIAAYGRRHERRRGEGPRPAGDPRPPSARRAKTPAPA